MDRGYIARNDASRARLAALVGRLTDLDMAREVDGLTVAGTLAHLAFWDRLTILRWDEAERSGREVPISVGQPLTDLVNDTLAHAWTALDPGEARMLALATAEACDAFTAALPDAKVAAAYAAGMDRAVERSFHREGHLAPIEAVLAERA
jgi:hypothetical protein